MEKRKRQRAQGIITAFVYISVISLISVYITTYAGNLHRLATRHINFTKAYYAAEAGAIYKMADLYSGNTAAVAITFPALGLMYQDTLVNYVQYTVDVNVFNLGGAAPSYRIESTTSNWW